MIKQKKDNDINPLLPSCAIKKEHSILVTAWLFLNKIGDLTYCDRVGGGGVRRREAKGAAALSKAGITPRLAAPPLLPRAAATPY